MKSQSDHQLYNCMKQQLGSSVHLYEIKEKMKEMCQEIELQRGLETTSCFVSFLIQLSNITRYI